MDAAAGAFSDGMKINCRSCTRGVTRSSGYAALDLVNERRTNLPINDRTAAEEWAMNFARNKPFPGVNPAWTNIGM